jgi:DNA repair exonuclease SbcCD ATPase subunit
MDFIMAVQEVTEHRDIEVITAEIQFYKAQAGTAIIEIGNRLIEAKEQLKHGEWLPWLSEKVDFSESSAQNFMRIAREYSNPQALGDLGVQKALALLALPPSEREGFVEETHEVNGDEKTVTEMSARELEQAVKERTEAIKAKEAAERIAKESEEKISELLKQRKQAEDDLVAMQQKVDKANFDKNSLEIELTELKESKPKLPDEDGQQMMEAMRAEIAAEVKKEAEAELQVKIDKAASDTAEANAKLNEAQEKAKNIEAEQDQIRREQEKQIQKLQKQLTVASSKHLTVFETHFENAQRCIKSMEGCINELKDEPETRGKLSAALRALCEQTIEGL